MAVRTYSVAASDVADKLPVDARFITASTYPVNTGDLTQYIQDVSGRLTAALQKAGRDPDNLDDDALSQAQSAVVQGAVAAALERMGRAGSDPHSRAVARYEEAMRSFETNPNSIAGAGSQVKTTVDTSPTNTRRGEFFGRNYEW